MPSPVPAEPPTAAAQPASAAAQPASAAAQPASAALPAPATPRAARPSPAHRAAVAARVGALVGGLLAVVGAVLPWTTMPDPFDASVRLVSAGVESRQGITTLLAGVVVVVLVAMGGRARLFWAVVPATLVVLVAGGALVDCLRPEPDLGGLLGALLTGPDAAYGLWITAAGGVAAAACALLAGRTAAAAQPPVPTP